MKHKSVNAFRVISLVGVASLSAWGSTELDGDTKIERTATEAGDLDIQGGKLTIGSDSGAEGWGGAHILYSEQPEAAGLSMWLNSEMPGTWGWGYDYAGPATPQMTLDSWNTITLYGTYPIVLDPNLGSMHFGGKRVLGQGEDDHTLSLGDGSSVASGYAALAGGANSLASGQYSVALGDGTEASGQSSFAIGARHYLNDWETAARGDYSIAMGLGASAGGFGSFVVGHSYVSDYEPSDFATAIGRSAASGYYATALGISNAMQTTSTALGASTALGVSSVAVGNSYASGEMATAAGQSLALGNMSTAVGLSTTGTTGTYSFAACMSSASGPYSATTGTSTVSYNGSYAVAFGYQSISGATAASALGRGTALGQYSLAAGYNARSTSFSATALGRFNYTWGSASSWIEDDPLLLVGNGTNTTTGATNAVTVVKNGQTTLTNKAWKARASEVPATADPSSATTDAGGNALVVEGHAVMKGKVVLDVAQGDISMGIFE